MTSNESATQFWEARDTMDLLRVFAQLHGLAVDNKQLAHEFSNGATVGVEAQALLTLQTLGFEVKSQSGDVAALEKSTMPAFVFRKDGRMLIIAQATTNTVVYQRAGAKGPEALRPEEFLKQWGGEWITARRKTGSAANASSSGMDSGSSTHETGYARFGLGWFWRMLKKYLPC